MIAGWTAISCWGAPSPSQVHGQEETVPESTQEPHPWIGTAPPAIARLVEAGHVQIVTNDERLKKAHRNALTVFRLNVVYRYQYKMEWNGLDPDDPSQQTGTIVAGLQLTQLEALHEIVLSPSFQPRDPWASPLLRHEFDHVSISTDPRFMKLSRRVLQRPIRCVVRWPLEKNLEPAAIDQEIKEAVSAQVAELERLVQANYDRLDQESSDGQANLSERSRFFTELYAMEWIRQCEFQYLDVLRATAHDSSDKEVKAHYLFLESP